MCRLVLVALCGLWLTAAASEVGAQSAEVRRAQERLATLGLSPGPVDGIMGSQTRDALRSFQRRKGLPVTGELDPETGIALAASIRTARDAAPPPKAVPVPQVAIEALPPPGTETSVSEATIRPAESAVAEAGARLEEPLGPPIGPPAGPDTAPEATRSAELRAETRSDAAARQPAEPEDSGLLGRIGPAVGLGLAAAAAWAGLLLYWLRERARRAGPTAAGE